MRKTINKYLCLLLIIMAVIACSGCASLYMVLDELYGNEAVLQAETATYVGFAYVDGTGNVEKWDALEFADSDSVIKEYSNDYFYNRLDENEQIIYNAYLYAMEHGYHMIYFDEKLTNDTKNLTDVLEALSLDSPLLEQNLRYGFMDFTVEYPINVLGIYERTGQFTGYSIRVYNFSEDFWKKKLEAIEVAKQIVEDLPKNLSEKEKAEKLYEYVAQNITYKEYKNLDDMEVKPYLYDALVKGKSHCDGYANALSLLYNMAGIESLEKTYTSGTEEVGHTWNTFALDGAWYNADATSISDFGKKERERYMDRYYGFPDIMQSYIPDGYALFPKCKNGLEISKIAKVKNAKEDKFVDSVVKGLQSKTKQMIVILDIYDEEDADSQMQKVANKISGTVNWIVYPVIEGKTALHVYK